MKGNIILTLMKTMDNRNFKPLLNYIIKIQTIFNEICTNEESAKFVVNEHKDLPLFLKEAVKNIIKSLPLNDDAALENLGLMGPTLLEKENKLQALYDAWINAKDVETLTYLAGHASKALANIVMLLPKKITDKCKLQ